MSGVDVSVIIPTRDRWHLVTRAVSCALAQVDVAIEVIVVDDASTGSAGNDDVWRDKRVRIVRRERPGGPARAHNAALPIATGRWLAWLDDDDLWAPDKLTKQLAVADDATTMVYAGAVMVDASLRPLDIFPAPPSEYLATALLADNVIPAGASNVLARAGAVRMLEGFDETFDHLYDWDMWLRLARSGRAARCDEVLVAYVIHGGNRHMELHDAMLEFDRLSAKHRAWSLGEAVNFDRAEYVRYRAGILVSGGRRMKACGELLRYGSSPPRYRNIRRAVAVLLGPRLMRLRRPVRGRRMSATAPGWLARYAA